MTKCELTLTYIEAVTWGWGCLLLKGFTLTCRCGLNMKAVP